MPSPQWATGAHEGGWWRSGALSCARPVNGVYRTRNGALQLRSFRLRRGRPHSSFTKPSRLARWRILSSNFMGREPRPPAMRSSKNPFHLAVTFSGSPSPSQRAVIDRKVQVSHLHRQMTGPLLESLRSGSIDGDQLVRGQQMRRLGEQRHRLEVLNLNRVRRETGTILHSGHQRQRLPRPRQLLQHLQAGE